MWLAEHLGAAAAASFEDDGCPTSELQFRLENDFVLSISPKGVSATSGDEPGGSSSLDSKWLSKWTQNNSQCLKRVFFRYGVLLFRGFNISDPLAFEDVALSLVPNLEKAYLGTSPRSQINGTSYVFTAADFSPHRTVPVHIEMSFRNFPPATQLFYAQQVEQWKGGETPLTDFQAVWEELSSDPALATSFGGSHLLYLRNMDDCKSTSLLDPLVQKCWQKMFKDEEDARQKCAEENFTCTWDSQTNRLTIRNAQPFIRPHPVTGKQIWYNHINVLHGQMMPKDYARTASLWNGFTQLWPMALSYYYRFLFGMFDLFFPATDLGSTVLKENGEAFTTQELIAMKAAIHQHTFNHAYKQGDIVMVDNHRIGHGREIYLGPKNSRLIYTAWSDHYPPSWQEVSEQRSCNAVQGECSAMAD